MKAFRFVSALIFAVSLAPATVAAQKTQPVAAPSAVVTELYRVHRNGYGHVFEKSGRKLQEKFFDRNLAGLIWKDLTETPEGDVGNLDFDPLYNAQDTKITNFRVGAPVVEGSKVTVPVSFNNFGKRTTINFLMVNEGGGWKIANIMYGSDSDLLKILSEPH
ncbi:MAG TPA: DUF3828 domain-containing protein [Pyrinomonadaceae bacterium]|nr:DUF3828 domain-containing protein [Pyrinomonadaceae bacterium]